MRIGEALALEWTDLDLHADIPCVHVAATLVELRRDAASGQVFVAGLHRQPMPKTGAARTIALPGAAVKMLTGVELGCGSTIGSRCSPMRAEVGCGRTTCGPKLRGVVAGTALAEDSPHTLCRTVGTLVGRHRRVIDVRHTLDPIFA